MIVKKPELSYAIQNQGEFVILALRGALTRESSKAFETCQKELDDKGGHYFILSLAELQDVDHIMIPRLIRFQKSLRERRGHIQVFASQTDLLKSLLHAGAIRKDELAPSPSEAMSRLRIVAEKEHSPEAQEAKRRQALANATEFERAVAGVRDEPEEEVEKEAEAVKAAASEEKPEKKGPSEWELLFSTSKQR